jgi:Na+/H+-dicarboxylate symporter
MNTLMKIGRSIRAAIVAALSSTTSAAAVPERVRLASRNGYGSNDTDRTRS